VIELIASGKLQVQDLISHRVSFDEMPGAIDLIEKHPEQTRKVLVELTSALH
jgi:L-gulonate 5-dehydrogenase